jgi:4-hydroxybenzoate polyprenyltransferase
VTIAPSAVLLAARPHQWVKNLLLVVPMIAAHRFDASTVHAVLLALTSFSLIASGNYILNDLLDVTADRQHPRKRWRPIAAGHLSVRAGGLVMATFWTLGATLAALNLPQAFLVTAAAYVAATAAYSIRLKREPVIDVVLLAGLYVLRVVAGGAATGIRVSTWLLAFTLFVCLSVAFLKRFIEIHSLAGGDARPVPGRGYLTTDAAWLHSAGVASAYLSVVVLAIYTNSTDVSLLYRHPDRLLLLCPVLLYAATRVWMLAHRQQLHDDPVIALTKDPVSHVVALLGAAIAWAAA